MEGRASARILLFLPQLQPQSSSSGADRLRPRWPGHTERNPTSPSSPFHPHPTPSFQGKQFPVFISLPFTAALPQGIGNLLSNVDDRRDFGHSQYYCILYPFWLVCADVLYVWSLIANFKDISRTLCISISTEHHAGASERQRTLLQVKLGVEGKEGAGERFLRARCGCGDAGGAAVTGRGERRNGHVTRCREVMYVKVSLIFSDRVHDPS